MLNEQTPIPEQKPKESVDEIVEAAYRKFGRDKYTLKAMSHCFGEPDEKRDSGQEEPIL